MSGVLMDDGAMAVAQSHAIKDTRDFTVVSDAVINEKSGPPAYDKASLREHSLSEVHDPDYPTEEEQHTLRRISAKIPWSVYTIAFIELCERFSYYGCTVVFTNFIQQELPPGSTTGAPIGGDGQAGALGLGQRASTGLTTFNSFWAYLMPIFGAWLADTHLGRYRTIMLAIGVAMVGHILLIVCAVPSVIIHPQTAVGIMSVAILIMGIGTGMFKSNISPLIAEQYSHSKLRRVVLPSGETVIVDPTLTVSRIYMYFYLMINVGALMGQIGMVYAEKYVGFWLSFTLPTAMFFLCPFVMLWGRKRYVRTPPTGSVLSNALKLWFLGMKGRWSLNPITTYKKMNDGTLWEKVKPSNIPENERPVWMTFDDFWVDEVKRGIKACNVFLWYPLYWLTYNQINNNLTSQAATMQTHGLPNDILSNLNPFALIICIPIFDLALYPALRKYGINFSPLKRICAGFGTGVLAMLWACVLQYYIYKKNPCGKYVSTCEDEDGNPLVADINVWAQTGSFVLVAISEIFASITGLEYAFTKAPANMKSLVTSLFLFMTALSTAIGFAFVSLSADPLLIWNYAVVAILAFVGAIGFYWSFKDLDRQEDALNNLQKSSYIGKKT